MRQMLRCLLCISPQTCRSLEEKLSLEIKDLGAICTEINMKTTKTDETTERKKYKIKGKKF